MKIIFSCLLVLIILFSSAWVKTSYTKQDRSLKLFEFITDSGYILKPEAEKLLSQIKYDSDSTDVKGSGFGLYDVKDTDTIGKFYKMDDGNYLAFLSDITHPQWNMFILLESTPKGEVLQSELYNAGMHQCCWEGSLGFKKYHDGYFGITSCGTGSGHCSSHIYFFKNFSPQGNTICSHIWTGWCEFTEALPIACYLTSDISIKNDTVTMHYTLERLKEKRNGKYKKIKEERFDVRYVKHDSVWVALDSTKISNFPL